MLVFGLSYSYFGAWDSLLSESTTVRDNKKAHQTLNLWPEAEIETKFVSGGVFFMSRTVVSRPILIGEAATKVWNYHAPTKRHCTLVLIATLSARLSRACCLFVRRMIQCPPLSRSFCWRTGFLFSLDEFSIASPAGFIRLQSSARRMKKDAASAQQKLWTWRTKKK